MNFKELVSVLPKDLLDYLHTFHDVPQDPKWHPEGSAWNHIVIVVDEVSKFDDPDLTMAALFHDLGKDRTTEVHSDGRVTSHGHAEVSLEVVNLFQDFIKWFGADLGVVRNLVKYHMIAKPDLLPQMNGKLRKQLQNNTVFWDKLMKLVNADEMLKER